MSQIDHLLDCIRVYRRWSGLSISGFARRAGVAPSPLRAMSEPAWNPNASTIRKCEAAIPPEFVRDFMTAANDSDFVPGVIHAAAAPQAARPDRGDDQSEAA
ncbi:MAG: hypothetical protein ABID63_18425 [Pseudomonadota bacterium]